MRTFLAILMATGLMAAPALAGGLSMAEKNAVVQAFAQDLINGHDLAVADGLFTADYKEHNPMGQDLPVDAFKGFAQAMFAGFPDVSVEYTPIVGEGDLITVVGHGQATHTGDFFGVPATGRPVQWTEMHVFRIRDGKIAERWVQADMFGIMQQITAPAE